MSSPVKLTFELLSAIANPPLLLSIPIARLPVTDTCDAEIVMSRLPLMHAAA